MVPKEEGLVVKSDFLFFVFVEVLAEMQGDRSIFFI